MTTITIKVGPEQAAWLERLAKTRRQSKSSIVRDLIRRQQVQTDGSLAESLADLHGCLNGSKDLSTRSFKGYGRR
jgi:predicted transcriptional regulator